MKLSKFILDSLKKIISNKSEQKLGLDVTPVDDLKRMIDACELLSTYDNMDTAKFFSSKQPDNIELKQAIQLLESCK